MENLPRFQPSRSRLVEQHLLENWPADLDGHFHFHYCIALSGGLDSMVLLKLFAKLREQLPQLELSALHVNHGISPHADSWEEFCRNECQHLKIPLQVSQLKVVKLAGQGLENTARQLRYQEFAQSGAQVIIMAHHADDQIETLLSQIMRGSALQNSAGMRSLSKRRGLWLWRPLLGYSKAQLQEYANEHKICNIEDESNHDNHYLRNFIRNRLLAQMREFDPQIGHKLLLSSQQLQAASTAVEELAQLDLASCRTKDHPLQLKLTTLAKLSLPRQQQLINYWLLEQQLPLARQERLAEFIRQLHTAAADRHPRLELTTTRALLRVKRQLHLISAEDAYSRATGL